MFLCSSCLIWDACRVATGFWGVQPPFFAVLSFVYKSTFQADLLRSLGQSHMRWSGLQHPKQYLFFFWYNSTALVKWILYSMDWSVSPPLLEASSPSPADDSVSPYPSGFAPESFPASSFPMVEAGVVKVHLPFSLCEGNKFPVIWECIMFSPLVAADLGGKGSLASAHLSSFHVAKRRPE